MMAGRRIKPTAADFAIIGFTAVALLAPGSFAAVKLEDVRTQINAIERDLLQTHENQISASDQLRKIRRLLQLQQKEIELSKVRVRELSTSMEELAEQKKLLMQNVETQKADLRGRLKELDRISEGSDQVLDLHWIANLDEENQKTYFLGKTLHKGLDSVTRLKQDVQEAMTLEVRILEEKNKVDYYVQELNSQMSLLSANEQLQREILRTNHASRLDALKRVRGLRDSERELEKMISGFRENRVARPVVAAAPVGQPDLREAISNGSVELTLAAMKGRLPLPADGAVLSGFGRSYNPKTSLLTFQKGITLGVASKVDVRAVSSGKVVFAGPLNNYGLIAIVEHPGQYFTLYGQMGSLSVATGATIAQGASLGKTSSEPLYFEIRNRNIAINPLQWLSNGSITKSAERVVSSSAMKGRIE